MTKHSQDIQVKVRTCNCTEVGIDTNGILFNLMKMQDKRWEHIHAVKKCPHWETTYIKLPKEAK